MISLPHFTRVGQFDGARIRGLWSMCASLPSFRLGCKDVSEFGKVMVDEQTIALESDWGWVFFTNLQNGRATVSFSFLDGQLSEHTEMAKECIRWAMDDLGLHRVQAIVPSSWKAYLRWLEDKIGFKREGILRQWTNGNAVMLSLIKEEI